MAVLVGACGGSTAVTTTISVAPTSTTSTIVSPSSLPATTTTATTVATTTTVAPATTTTTESEASGPFRVVWEDLTLGPPDPLPGSDGASGSGCEPGGDELPDGIWFGYILSENESDATIDFDLACFYFGDIARAKAAEEGEEAYNDYWIVNQSDKIRTLWYPAKATAWTITGDPSEGHFPRLFITEWPEASAYLHCPGESCGVWLYMNDGRFDDAVEQYIP